MESPLTAWGWSMGMLALRRAGDTLPHVDLSCPTVGRHWAGDSAT